MKNPYQTGLKFWAERDQRVFTEGGGILTTGIAVVIGLHNEPELAAYTGIFFVNLALLWSVFIHNQVRRRYDPTMNNAYDPYVDPMWRDAAGSRWHRLKQNGLVLTLLFFFALLILIAYVSSLVIVKTYR